MPPSTSVEKAVVLVTPADDAVRESGSGFVILDDKSVSYVVTCAHVLRDWNRRARVNGVDAEIVHDGEREGVDLAILRLPSLGLGALRTKSFVRDGAAIYGVSYAHLYGADYVRGSISARAGRNLVIQNRRGGRTVPAWEVLPGEKDALSPGNSGSPLVDAKSHRVAGILTHANRDGRAGIALSPLAIDMIWDPPVPLDVEADPRDLPRDRPPAISTPITDEEDLNRGRFGGRPRVDGRELIARITQKKSDYFYYDLAVLSRDDSPMVGPAIFYLHDTYPRAKVTVRRSDDAHEIALRDIYSYGTYVAGCQCKNRNGEWISLELDLATLAEIPKRFIGR